MAENAELTPFFERMRAGPDLPVGESYVAGLREPNGGSISVEIKLPAEIVERTVLTGAGLSISLAPDGRLVLDADGVDDDTLEAASAAGGWGDQTVESLVAACVDPELLAGDDEAVDDLTLLRAQLVRALALLDGTLERLRHA
jgi:hypothetical protein